MIRSMKTMVAALGVTAMLAGASAAQAADNVVIDLDGVGGNAGVAIQSIDLNAGNSLSVGGNTAADFESFDVYFQSTITALNAAGGGTVDLGGYYLTTVVKFSELRTGTATIGSSAFVGFGEGSGTDEYFELWLSTTAPAANMNLTGEGFGADGTGILILSGSSVTITSGFFGVDTAAPVEDFDQTTDGDNYAGFQTVVGNGTTVIETSIDFANTDYIRGLGAGDVISLVLANPASSTTPFDAVNPAQKFWDATTNSYVSPSLGNVNGLAPIAGGTGDDFQFQTNGNLTFETTSNPIPEPATAAMGLFGLAGLALAARRRR